MRVGQSRRRDANEKPIIEALQDLGADVTQVSGKGAPDLLVRWRGRVYGFEVKSAKGQRTEAQELTGWPIVRDVEDALKVMSVSGKSDIKSRTLISEPNGTIRVERLEMSDEWKRRVSKALKAGRDAKA